MMGQVYGHTVDVVPASDIQVFLLGHVDLARFRELPREHILMYVTPYPIYPFRIELKDMMSQLNSETAQHALQHTYVVNAPTGGGLCYYCKQGPGTWPDPAPHNSGGWYCSVRCLTMGYVGDPVYVALLLASVGRRPERGLPIEWYYYRQVPKDWSAEPCTIPRTIPQTQRTPVHIMSHITMSHPAANEFRHLQEVMAHETTTD
jgi:hypothetical protein